MEELLRNIANLPEDQKEQLFKMIKDQGINVLDLPITKENERTAPLSYAQERLWFLHQMFHGDASDNVPVAFRITGDLNISYLESGFKKIIARHDILRSIFVKKGTGLNQEVVDDVRFSIKIIDLTGQNLSNAQLATQVGQESRITFDFEQLPLMRVTVFNVGNDQHVMLINLHHVVTDGWSLGLIYKELEEVYLSLIENRPPDLPELTVQYSDFALWQRNLINEEILEDQISYWMEQLTGSPPVLELPKDHPRPGTQSFKGGKHRLEISGSLFQGLVSLSKEMGCTVFMTLTAVFQVLLYRYTSNEDIIVATPIANRFKPETEHLIGLFLNMLVLRSDLSGNPTFKEFLLQVKSSTLLAYENQNLPFEKLVEKLSPTRDMSYHPLFQVVLQISPKHKLNLSGLEVELFDFDSGTAQYDLALHLFEDKEGMAGYFEYNSDLFEESTMARMEQHFLQLLQSVTDDASLSISDLNILSTDESNYFQNFSNQELNQFPPEKTLVAHFEKQVESEPLAIAIKFEEQEITYQQLNEKSNQLAHKLISSGISEGDLIGICLERSLELVVGILGILKAGAAYLPIDLSYPKERLSFMLKDAKAPLLLTQQSLADKIPESASEVLFLDTFQNSPDQSNPGISTDPMSLAYVIYTSGSTGKPKGVKVNHYNVARLFQSTEHWFNFTKDDVWTLFHSYAFDFSVWEIWGALLYGGKLIVVPQLSTRAPDVFYDLLVNEGVTVLNQTPSAFNQLIDTDEKKSNSDQLSLRKVIFGGEALELQNLKPWFDRHGDQKPHLVNMYGITETTVHVTYRPISKADLSSGSVIGEAIPDLKVYILDKNQKVVPIGVSGEMYVGGAGVSDGYLDRPELNEQRFISNPFNAGETLYRTGDLARFLSPSDIEYLGRIDHQVKIRGFRIELGEIEAALIQEGAGKDAVVLVREDIPGDKRLVAYLIADQDEIDVGTIRSQLINKLPEYMVPANYVVMDKFPITANGKLDRKALPVPKIERLDASEYIAPTSELEQNIASVWQNHLDLGVVGIDDNFFDLGGHSLLMVKVHNDLKEKLSTELSIVDLYRYPTIRGLKQHLAKESDLGSSEEKISDRAKKQKEMLKRQKARNMQRRKT